MADYDSHGLSIPSHWSSWLTSVHMQEIDRLRDFLISSNMTGRMLATQHEDHDRVVFYKQLSNQLSLSRNSQFEILFNYWIDAAIKSAPFKRRLTGEKGPLYQSVINDALLDVASKCVSEDNGASHSVFIPLSSRRRKSLMQHTPEELENQREQKEIRELGIWSTRLYNLYDQRDAPVAKQVDSCLNPSRAMLELAGSTRPKTLKTYIQHWYRFESFLVKVKNRSWPSSPEDYIDYIHMLADEPCGPSVPESFIIAASFIERKSGLGQSETFSQAPLVKAVLQRTVELLRGPSGPTKRAPRVPSVIIESLEGLVMDVGAPRYLRGIAWLRLVKVWTGMRFSCHHYLSPSRLNLFEGELFGTLRKTKTTGPTRRVKELPIHVSKAAFIRYGSWLQTGFELWQTLAPFSRDYFLPKPTADGNHTIRKAAEYSEAAASGIEALSVLRVPNSHVLLLDINWAPFFTEHSERPTLVTALVSLSSSKEERDLVGRWRPEGSDTYIRTYHAAVSKLQARVAETMRSPDRYEQLHEREISQSFHIWCRERFDLSPDEADTMASAFARVLKIPPQGVVDVETTVAQTVPDSPTEIPDQITHHEEASDSSEDGAPRDWFISKSRPSGAFIIVRDNRGRGRLHKSDGCWIARYRSLKFPTLCTQEPGLDSYDFRCRLCWPAIESNPAENHSSEESSSHSMAEEEEEVEDLISDLQQPQEELGNTQPRTDTDETWSIAGQDT